MADAQDSTSDHQPDWSALIESHYPGVYRYAFRLTGSVQDAEDLCQQAFLAARIHWNQLRDHHKVANWLLTITRHQFLKSCRRRPPRPASPLDLDVEQVPQRPDRLAGIDVQGLQAALNSLPDEYRLVLLMFYFEGQSYLQIAEQLQIPMGTVMSRLSRAKRRLRGLIEDDGCPVPHGDDDRPASSQSSTGGQTRDGSEGGPDQATSSSHRLDRP